MFLLLKASGAMAETKHLKNLSHDAFCLPFFLSVLINAYVENNEDDTGLYLSFILSILINV